MKADCSFFRPSALAPWVCSRWCVPIKGEPFCAADLECETQGRRKDVITYPLSAFTEEEDVHD